MIDEPLFLGKVITVGREVGEATSIFDVASLVSLISDEEVASGLMVSDDFVVLLVEAFVSEGFNSSVDDDIIISLVDDDDIPPLVDDDDIPPLVDDDGIIMVVVDVPIIMTVDVLLLKTVVVVSSVEVVTAVELGSTVGIGAFIPGIRLGRTKFCKFGGRKHNDPSSGNKLQLRCGGYVY